MLRKLVTTNKETNRLLERIQTSVLRKEAMLKSQEKCFQDYSWVMSQKVSNIESRHCFTNPDESSVIRGACQSAEGSSWGITPECLQLAIQSIKDKRAHN